MGYEMTFTLNLQYNNASIDFSLWENNFDPSYTLGILASSADGSNMKKFVIPYGVKTLNNTCRYFSKLEEVEIADTVNYIGGSACFNSPVLQKYYLAPNTPPTLANTGTMIINTDTVVIVPWSADHSILNAYKAPNNWSTLADNIFEAAPEYVIPETV